VFCSDRDGISNLYALRIADRSLSRVTNVLGGAFQPSVSPDGRSVAYADYSSLGFDVRIAPLEISPAPAPSAFVDALPAAAAGSRARGGAVDSYRPWSMLVPRFWSPWIELGDSEDRLGLATGGSDALFPHVWAARPHLRHRHRASQLQRLLPLRPLPADLIVSGQNTSAVSERGDLRTLQLNLQASMPLRRTVRSIHSLSLAYRRESEEVLGSTAPEDRAELGGLQASWIWSSARAYPMSISPSEGSRMRVSWLREAEGLGSDVPSTS
jgi:hypothetical protein